jgi:branched-chain amino acid transport system substrate-binding protein
MKKKSCVRKGGGFFMIMVCMPLTISLMLGLTPRQSASQSQSPIKIGLLYPFTGPTTHLGQRMLRGWEIAFEKVNYTVAGRPVKFIVEDEKGDPSTGLTKATKLIEQDRVHVLGGLVNSAVAYAIRDKVDESKVPLIITMANAGGLTRERRSPYIFRSFAPGGTASHYMADFIYKELKLRKALFAASDYAYGREHAEMFKKEFERLGGQVLFETFVPLGAPDFGPYCTKLADFAGKADVLHYVYSGTDAIRFVKTAAEVSLKKKFTMTEWGGMEDGYELSQVGAAAEGIYKIQYYCLGVKTQANQQFIALDKKKGGHIDVRDYFGYIGAEVILRALEKVRGSVEAKDEFLKAIRENEFESATGPFKFDSRSQNMLVNLFITQIREVNGEFGKYQNVILKTLSQVQDPWWVGR